MPSRRFRLHLMLFLLLLPAMPRLVGQVNTGDVVGTLTDVSGAVMPDVTVTIRNSGYGRIPSSTDRENGRL